MSSDKTLDMPSSVLFLCDHNVIRSPMGEALMKAKFGTAIFAQSAGVRTGEQDPFVQAVLAEQNIDYSRHNPKRLDELDDTWFDLIICFSEHAHEVALKMQHIEANQILYWPAADPTGETGSRERMLQAYRDVRDSIGIRLQEHFGSA